MTRASLGAGKSDVFLPYFDDFYKMERIYQRALKNFRRKIARGKSSFHFIVFWAGTQILYVLVWLAWESIKIVLLDYQQSQEERFQEITVIGGWWINVYIYLQVDTVVAVCLSRQNRLELKKWGEMGWSVMKTSWNFRKWKEASKGTFFTTTILKAYFFSL